MLKTSKAARAAGMELSEGRVGGDEVAQAGCPQINSELSLFRIKISGDRIDCLFYDVHSL